MVTEIQEKDKIGKSYINGKSLIVISNFSFIHDSDLFLKSYVPWVNSCLDKNKTIKIFKEKF